MATPAPFSSASYATSLARFSTGTKMLLILTAALLPLGLIALFASIQSDRVKRVQRGDAAGMVATGEARQIDVLLLRGSNMLRGALATRGLDRRSCERMLQRNAGGFPTPIQLALFERDGGLRCATRGFDPIRAARPRPGVSVDVRLLDAPGALRFATGGGDGSYGVGQLPQALLRQVMPATDGSQSIILRQGAARLTLVTPSRQPRLGRHILMEAPVASGQATLGLTLVVNPISAVEVLLVLLPLLMWAAAAAIGWIVVDHLLLRPLGQLQRAVTAYGEGGGAFELPEITTPAQEIVSLAGAFGKTTAQLAHREEALEQGLSHQVRLTREVHHRVKNNLQVVASLINLHSRGTEGEVAAAYASIQRRVDALAVVHRNHFAELEQNRGVALRSIIAELTSNLRATAPPAASHLTIALDLVPAFVTQDVAVPVAFLVTEVVELAMTCDPLGGVTIILKAGSAPDRAILSISAAGLVQPSCTDHPSRERFQRIVTGLSRQLRAPLQYDAATGHHAIELAILPQDGAEENSHTAGTRVIASRFLGG